jgi:hypothetical protein
MGFFWISYLHCDLNVMGFFWASYLHCYLNVMGFFWMCTEGPLFVFWMPTEVLHYGRPSLIFFNVNRGAPLVGAPLVSVTFWMRVTSAALFFNACPLALIAYYKMVPVALWHCTFLPSVTALIYATHFLSNSHTMVYTNLFVVDLSYMQCIK